MTESPRETRVCRCGCGLQFTVNSTSRKTYLNRRQKEMAKNYRRKLALAGVAV